MAEQSMYAPLQFISLNPDAGHEFESQINMLAKNGFNELKDVTEEEYIRHFMSTDFLNPSYKGKFTDFHRAIINALPSLRKKIQDENGNFDPITEMRDLHLATVLFGRWARNKQVYKPDSEFAKALLHTEKMQISKYNIDHLPVNDFYIDLQNCDFFAPAIGIFVHVVPFEQEFCVATYLITSDMVFFSFYTGGEYNEQGIAEINYDGLSTSDYTLSSSVEDEYKAIDFSKEKKLNRKETSVFAMQFLCYITSKEPEIEENPITKGTYKKPSKVSVPRNKFSEVQQWDVGIHYGKRIRIMQDEIKKNSNKQVISTVDGKVQRKSPVPHFRSAHWQHYWTGKGRTICEVKWIEPTFVGLNAKESSNITIHTIG